MFAILLAPLTLLSGLSIELSRTQVHQEMLQRALDAAALAIARVREDLENPEAVVEAYLRANLESSQIDAENVDYELAIDDTLTSREVWISAVARVPAAFSALMQAPEIVLTAEASAREVFRDLEISLVLDISSSMRGSKIRELKSAAETFLDIVFDDQDQAQHTHVSIIPYGGTVRLGDDFEDALDGDHHPDAWRGCLDTGDEIMNDERLEDGAYAPLEHFWRWNQSNPWCPRAGNEAMFFSNDKGDLVDLVRDFGDLSDGTGSDIGAAFGLKALSPEWRGLLRDAPSGVPADYTDATVKALVIMTDGGITQQFRPQEDDYADQGEGPNIYYRLEKQDTINSKDDASDNFMAVCDAARYEGGIAVYTVGFEVKQTWMLDLLRDCASTGGNYFEANGSELTDVFATIARNLEPLRLTQ